MRSAEVHPMDGSMYAPFSLGFISIESPIRKWLIKVASPGTKFDFFILMMIILNSTLMAFVDYRYVNDDYEPLSDVSWRNRTLEIAEYIFLIIFFVECLAKIIAFGFIRGSHAYLRSSWNVFDFITVVISIVSVVPVFPNLSALRSFRLLRPLRSVSKLPGLRKIVGALMESSGDLVNVILVLTFLIICFGIIGMQFWQGLLHARCRLTPYPVLFPSTCNSTRDVCWNDYIKNVTENPAKYRCLYDDNDNDDWTQSTSPWFTQGPQDCIWPIDDTDERVCNLHANGGHVCYSFSNGNKDNNITLTCGSNFDSFGNPRFIDDNRPFGYPRMLSATFTDALNWGLTNYDSFFNSFFTSFQVITLEGWSDIMYQVTDAWLKVPAVIIFACQVIVCGYIVLHLVLAVITKSIDELDVTTEQQQSEHINTFQGSVGVAECPSASQECSSENECVASMSFVEMSRLQKFVEKRFYSMFLTCCIILNTIVLSLDHYGISEGNAELLEKINVVFTVIFILDVVFSNMAFGMKKYWRDPFMRFDGFVGGLSFLELILMHNFQFSESGSSSFSVLRSLRLFRIFKMAKRWKSLQLLIRTIVASISEIGNFAALLFLFILIYSLIGMQLLANRLHFSGENGSVISITDRYLWESALIPRSNFDNFYSSMVTVFQILSGENWNVVLYDCWRARGWVSVVFIISLIVVGVFIVMNLFLAILLKNFEESGTFVDQEKLENVLEVKRTKELNPNPEIKRPSKIQILWAKIGKDNPIRKFCLMVAQSSKFDLLITLLIILSNFCLAVDNPLSDPETILARVLNICDIAFTCLFSAEMVIKILAYGLISETDAYLRDTWNILDCAVLLVSIFNISGVGPGSSFKSLRALRVLRTLRMINRFPELKVVVDALLLSLPSVADVAVLCAVFFLIFASFGVNFLKGTFYHCTGTNFENLTDEKLNYLMNPFEWSNLTNEQKAWFDTDAPGCGASTWTADTVPKSKDICDCLAPGGWSLVVPQNFDNVLNGMALLFEISTTEGWIEVMYAATDQRGIGMQPIKNHNPVWALFFIIFLIFGAFFVLELFVGVTIDNFKKIREETGRSLMTEGQKNWARTQQFVLKIRPMRKIHRPQNKLRAICFDLTNTETNPQFDNFITVCIILSAIVSASYSFGDSELKLQILGYMNSTFAAVFTIEVLLKITALSKRYFDDRWNVFDFLIVCCADIGLILGFFLDNASPVIGVIRLARIGRLFRIVKTVKKFRTLFNTLFISLPSIANIGALLLLLYFIYAVVGVQLFCFIPNNGILNNQANFRSLGSAMLLLLRFSTGENWNGFMRSIINDRDGCDKNPNYRRGSPWCVGYNDDPHCTPLNGCGAGFSTYLYFYSFTLLISFVILNLFVGIVLEAFENSNEGEILNSEDLDDFVTKWSYFDPNATWYIRAQHMKNLVMVLNPPLGIGCRDIEKADEFLDDPCLKGLEVNANGKVNIVHAATSLAKRLAIKKLGEHFKELSEEHRLRKLSRIGESEKVRTLDEIFLERSRKKMRILRAIVKLGRASADQSASV